MSAIATTPVSRRYASAEMVGALGPLLLPLLAPAFRPSAAPPRAPITPPPAHVSLPTPHSPPPTPTGLSPLASRLSPPASPLSRLSPLASRLPPAAASLPLLLLSQPAHAADVSWIAPTKLLLGPLLSVGTLLFLLRVVLSWFPKYDLDELPWSLAARPTEPFLKPTRALIPPVAGVDISPLVWVGLLSFCNEILLGPQGLLTIMQRKGGL
ncbi:hypothetical protein AB1Y20_014101 [Prymnesium parvum]|uniref:Uncharacterized protein n=1 Tax=Prymnesium parvum TaxID=97485 RepID=A0AB34IHB5_PRYPA